ncbi:MAG: anaerobic sulfatase maturase [Lentisphaerae bacterium GWF2_52_8]|nr:MAG: anaerobic sulfatase maturase [Lentisphaerae bacterium GWF2_52_8]
MNHCFSLLVKPASYCCNLRCAYCFYLKKSEVFGEGCLKMDDHVLSVMMQKFMALRMPVSSIGWQGGEPTLMGLDFFRRAVALQKQFASPGQRIANALQTNGTLLDDEWGAFLHENLFLVGISLDGPPDMHNLNRVWADGRGSHEDVLRGMNVLRRNKVEFNVLTLVSSANQDHPLAIYKYLKELGVMYHQYIECVEFDGNGTLMPFSVAPEKWGEFLCTIFDEWYKSDVRAVSVRLFDSILVKILDGYPNLCMLGSDCRQYFVVEYNGDIFPCDFHVKMEWRLGNIVKDEFKTLMASPSYREFGARKHKLNQQCATCEYLSLCAGCCPKNRPGHDTVNLSALCKGWKMFYGHTIERFKELAKKIAMERKELTRQRAMGLPPPGRNVPCPCGSGKKYKNCCGA